MKYHGMTVNERLYVSGLMDAFDKAIKEKKIQKVKSILEDVELNEESINPILKAFGLISDNCD
jgi:iron uptake system EfeUOB component EfeO/EfeM